MGSWGGKRWSDLFDIMIIGKLSKKEELNLSLLEGSAHIFNHSPSFRSGATDFWSRLCSSVGDDTLYSMMPTSSHQSLPERSRALVKLCSMALCVGNAYVGALRLCYWFDNNNNINNNETRPGSLWLSLTAWYLQPWLKGSCKVSRAPMAVSSLQGQQREGGWAQFYLTWDAGGFLAALLRPA